MINHAAEVATNGWFYLLCKKWMTAKSGIILDLIFILNTVSRRRVRDFLTASKKLCTDKAQAGTLPPPSMQFRLVKLSWNNSKAD